ncbi:MAG TPA: DUF4358 domain-containing protein [Firmicutes bacterium]|nr:DUF4358 domain-containing protein [Bacillota bacterium]
MKTSTKQKVFAIFSVFILMIALASCNGEKESKATSAEIFDGINAAFAEKYPDVGGAVTMPMDIDDETLSNVYGITTEMVEDYKGQVAGSMTNCDMLLVVKAKDGQVENVQKALEDSLAARVDQFEWYAVMGNDIRTKEAKVVVDGNYAALLMVGIIADDTAETFDFASDVKLAEDTFHQVIEDGKK